MTYLKVGGRVRVKDEELTYRIGQVVRQFIPADEKEIRGSYATVQGFDLHGDVKITVDGQGLLWAVAPKHLETVVDSAIFKAGDIVRIKDETLTVKDDSGEDVLLIDGDECRGRVATINDVSPEGDCVNLAIVGDEDLYDVFVSSKHLELVTEDTEKVNHPPHYNTGKIEVIDFIEDQGLDFHLGNVVKYVTRAAHKNSLREDLEKAKWYIERRLELTE